MRRGAFCRMRRKRLIRPTCLAPTCRPDKTRQRRIRHCAPTAGCGVNTLSDRQNKLCFML
ncbi:putative ribonucleotide-diphosphate reductase subunit beta [Escherichia coli MS 153-1]|nr:putative ribonucleotide-diphosphate reductase subunit beta [Escherichia coli MS 153-1]